MKRSADVKHPAEELAIERWNQEMLGAIPWESAIAAGLAIPRLRQACLDLGYPDPTQPPTQQEQSAAQEE